MPDWVRGRLPPAEKDKTARGFTVDTHELPPMTSPINTARLREMAHDYPFDGVLDAVCDDLESGAVFGVDAKNQPTRDSPAQIIPNHKSAHEHKPVVEKYLAEQIDEGNFAGPFDQPFPGTVTGPLRLVVQEGKVRVCESLSGGRPHSLNDYTDPVSNQIFLAPFEQMVSAVSDFGTEATMSKFDGANAFRYCFFLHESQISMSGIEWEGKYYIDRRLSFGSRAAPAIFDRMMSVIMWAVTKNVRAALIVHGQSPLSTKLKHYLDDIGMASSNATTGAIADATAEETLLYIGYPVKEGPRKRVRAASEMKWLGLDIDAKQQLVTIPCDKVDKLKAAIAPLVKRSKKNIKKKELQQLVGVLQYVAKAIPMAKHLFSELYIAMKNNAIATITDDLRHDLRKISQVVTKNSGAGFRAAIISSAGRHDHRSCEWKTVPLVTEDTELVTDASGTIGLAAIDLESGEYFNLPLPAEYTVAEKHGGDKLNSMAWLEMIPCLGALSVWGESYRNKCLLWHCDNEATVNAVKKGYSTSRPLNRILKHIQLKCAELNCVIRTIYIATKDNILADAASRFQMQLFHDRMQARYGHEGVAKQAPRSLQRKIKNSMRA